MAKFISLRPKLPKLRTGLRIRVRGPKGISKFGTGIGARTKRYRLKKPKAIR